MSLFLCDKMEENSTHQDIYTISLYTLYGKGDLEDVIKVKEL